MTRRIWVILIVAVFATLIGAYIYLEEPFSKDDSNNSKDEQKGNVDNTINIEYISNNFKTYKPSVVVGLITDKEVKIEGSNYKEVQKNFVNNKYEYAVKIDNLKTGINEITVKVFDLNNNELGKIKYTIDRVSYSSQSGISTIEDWPNTTYVLNGNDYLVVVDKSHRLTDEFEPNPENLVDLNKDLKLLTNVEGILLDQEAASQLKLMLTDLKRDTGKDVIILSGYRSIFRQYQVYDNVVKSSGLDEANKKSAKPGYSEHHLATVIDFISKDNNYQLTQEFENTAASNWLEENAHKYGYVLSYPKGQAQTTGYEYEPWHYRYIGVDKAEEYKNQNQPLNIWLGSQ